MFNFTLCFSQTESHAKVVKLIDDFCLGSPIASDYKQIVKAKFIDKNTLQVVEETLLRSDDNLIRKNVFTFKLSDLDAENLLISGASGNLDKDKFAVRLYCKKFAKKIKQDVFLLSVGSNGTTYAEFFYLGNFVKKEVLEELKEELIKLIKATKAK